jgi:hypothetical protein
MNQRMNEWNEWKPWNGCNEWRKEGMNDWMNEGTNERRNERMNEWMIEWLKERRNERMNEWMKFADLIFQKCSRRDIFLRSLCEIELSLQSCALFVDDRGPKPRKKTQCFALENLFKLELMCSWPVTLPNYLMMMWLTWWWECSPWQSSITRKFSK